MYYTVIKHDEHLRTGEGECRNTSCRHVLSQWNTHLRLLYLHTLGFFILIKSAFRSLKVIVDTMIDNLDFRCECSSPFQDTAASKVQLTSAQGQLYRSSN